MSQIALRLPNSLATKVKALAKEDGVSVNSFIALTLAEKVAVMLAEDRSYVKERAAKADIDAALAVLNKVKD